MHRMWKKLQDAWYMGEKMWVKRGYEIMPSVKIMDAQNCTQEKIPAARFLSLKSLVFLLDAHNL